MTAFPRVPASVRYRVEPRERGDCTTRQLYVALSLAARPRGALGQGAARCRRVRVYPALRTGEEQQIFLARSRQIDLQLRQARQRGLGRDFESLRDYREGDDLRDICWTASARRGRPDHAPVPDRAQPARVDRARLRPPDALAGRGRWTKRHCRSPSGSRARTTPSSTTPAPPRSRWRSLRSISGDRVGLLAYGQRHPAAPAARPRRCASAPDDRVAGTGARRSRARPTTCAPPRCSNRLQPRRSLILWITDLAETAMRPEVIDGAMQLLRRHVLLFVAMAQPEVDTIAAARPKNVEQMFRAAAAQEMAGRRELLLARLHEQGALTLDLNPEALTSSVLNQYLTVKERAMV